MTNTAGALGYLQGMTFRWSWQLLVTNAGVQRTRLLLA
jgi:hypothetical protein